MQLEEVFFIERAPWFIIVFHNHHISEKLKHLTDPMG